jgi:hypothetical protein
MFLRLRHRATLRNAEAGTKVNFQYSLLRLITVGAFVAGVLFTIAGVTFVFLGATGQTEFSFFGQDFKSSNVGIGALFIGAASTVLLIRRALGSFDKLIRLDPSPPVPQFQKAPGHVVVTDLQVNSMDDETACVLDFRVKNPGDSDVMINKIVLRALKVEEWSVLSYAHFSGNYSVDISEVEKRGDQVECSLSQIIKPGEVDRFGVTLIASRLKMGTYRRCRFFPTLITSAGDVQAPEVELTLRSVSQTPYKIVRPLDI